MQNKGQNYIEVGIIAAVIAIASVLVLSSLGKNIDEIVAAKPTADYDAKWGGGFLKPDQWVQVIYSVVKK